MAKQPKLTRDGQVDLSISERAARRSRSGGVWSLGHLAICWAALAAGGVVLGLVGLFVAGHRALVGVAVGTLIVGAFFTLSTVVIAWVGQRYPKRVMWAALGTYLVKVIALGVVLVMIPRNGPVLDTRWMAGAIGLGLFLWLGAHMRYVWTTKLFYVDPS
jgi:ATP synthase protein I